MIVYLTKKCEHYYGKMVLRSKKVFVMKKKEYIKPTIQEVRIVTNELCAGSQNASIPFVVKPIKHKEDYTKKFGKGETKGTWDPKF